MKYLLAALAILLYPMASQAGAGFEFRIDNGLTPSPEDPDYPQFTVHRVGGSTCWFDNGLEDWNQFAKPGGSVVIYTERKNSGTCYWALTDPAVRGVAYFVKRNKVSGWVQVGSSFSLTNAINSPAVFFTDGKDPRTNCDWSRITPLPGYNGYLGYLERLDAYAKSCSINGMFFDSNYRNFTLDILPWGKEISWATIKVYDKAPILYPRPPEFGLSSEDAGARKNPSYSVPANESDIVEANNPIQAIEYVMQTGEKKVLRLTGLDPESEWELDQCTGDAVLSSAVIPQHTRKKDLPDALEIRAIKPGQSVCELTAWHYPERSKIISRRYTFNVRAP